jgi:AcrR family transcriptional regulator
VQAIDERMQGTMNDKLPAGLDLLWGRRDGPASEPRQGLSLSGIVRAAVELADADGLDAVSLYRHVRSKNEVLLLMLDSVAAVPAELDEPCDDWRLGLQRWCRAQWVMLRAHSWVVHLPITGPPITPNQLAWTDRALRALRGTELAEADKVGVVLLVANYMLVTARLSTDLGPAASGESIAAYSTLLSGLVDAHRFPALRTAIDAGAFDYPPDTAEKDRQLDYAFGLDRILDGVETLIRRRAG